MFDEQPHQDLPQYLSYLIRLWRTDASPWRASVETPGTHEKQSFTDVATLFAFLQAQMGAEHSQATGTEPKGGGVM